VLFEPDLELVAASGDPSLALELDALDLAVRPGVDTLDVLLGQLAQLLGLEGFASADRVDMDLATLLGALGVARLLGGRGALHRSGELGEERRLIGLAGARLPFGTDGAATRPTAVGAEVGLVIGHLALPGGIVPQLARGSR